MDRLSTPLFRVQLATASLPEHVNQFSPVQLQFRVPASEKHGPYAPAPGPMIHVSVCSTHCAAGRDSH